MKIMALIAVIFSSIVLMLSGCTPPGPVTTKNFDISGFDEVESSGGWTVEIIPSENYSVSVTANDNLFNYVQVSLSGKTLKIETRGFYFYPGATLKARVTMPGLKGLKFSGASSGIVHGFKSTGSFEIESSGASLLDIDVETDKFSTDVSGAGRIKGRLKAANADIHASGAGHINLEGSADTASLEVSGGSSVTMPDFTVMDASVNLSGGSHASLTVNRQLDANLSGGSRLDYGGNPTLRKVNVSGGASLKPR